MPETKRSLQAVDEHFEPVRNAVSASSAILRWGLMRITDYSFGCISIDGAVYRSDVIVFPRRVQEPWWRKEGHRLDVSDLAEVMRNKPRTLVVGTGYYGNMRIPDETLKALDEGGIRLIAARTGEAVQLFNAMAESADIVAALHLSC